VLPQPRAERDELIEIREPVRLGNQNAGEEHSPTLAHAYQREQSKTRTLDLNIANCREERLPRACWFRDAQFGACGRPRSDYPGMTPVTILPQAPT
jgi:hypothetical protein